MRVTLLLAATMVTAIGWTVACNGQLEEAAPACATPAVVSTVEDAGADAATAASRIANDLQDDALARICDAQNRYLYGQNDDPMGVLIGMTDFSIDADVIEMRTDDGKYQTRLHLVSRSTTVRWDDPVHGKSRTDSFYDGYLSLLSDVPRPDAFAVGKTESVSLIGGLGYQSWCAEDGQSVLQGGSATGNEPAPVSETLTITKRTADRIGGIYQVVETAGAAARVATFDASLVKRSKTPICCLR